MKKRRRQPNHDRVPVYMVRDALHVLVGLRNWEGGPVTRLPVDSRLCVDRPDLPEYELNQACPVTGEVSGLENHHIWRRSAGFGSWWVELPTGEIVGNRINLSSEAHYRVTVNKARIAYTDGIFDWVENDEWTPLKWQPPVWKGEAVFPSDDDAWIYQPYTRIDVSGIQSQAAKGDTIYDMHTHEVVGKIGPQPGEECTACHRRVPHPKKKTSPLTSVFSTRVPIGDKETFAELVDAAAEHMGAKSKPHHVYNTLLVGLALILQSPKEDLPNG